MPEKNLSLKFDETRPRLERVAHVPKLVGVTNDESWVDSETELGDDDVRASKFGGAPLLTADAPHPRCGRCKVRLGFVAQLRREELPPPYQAMVKGDLLQLFWCDPCQSGGGAEDPWSKAVVVREISAVGMPLSSPKRDDEDADPLRVTFVRGWEEITDYPVGTNDELSRVLGVRAKSAAARAQLEAISEAMSSAGLGTRAGIKLGGWPRWTQEPEWVRCKCKADDKTDMRMLLQLGDAVSVGDGGSVWIFHCDVCGKRAVRYQQ